MAANKEKAPYSVMSYFCGCGGLDLGFRGGFKYHDEDYPALPFNIIEAYDNEPRCIETYNDYFGTGHALVKDLAAVKPEEIPKADILIGGFPCQEFSSCGPLGGLESERGRLYQTLIAYMNTHKPKIVVGENVINLERMEKGEVLKTIKKNLMAAGYTVKVWKMFAPDYGVPQRRTRLMIMCVRKDLFEEYGFPKEPEASVYKGYKRDKIEMRGNRAEISDFPLYLNTVAGGLDRRDQTIGGFSFVVKIYALPVVEIIGQLLYLLGRYGFNAQFGDCL